MAIITKRIKPGDSPEVLSFLLEDPSAEADPTKPRYKEVGTVTAWADPLPQGTTTPSQIHIEWEPSSHATLSASTLNSTIII